MKTGCIIFRLQIVLWGEVRGHIHQGAKEDKKIGACDLNIENTKCFCLDAALNTHFLLEKKQKLIHVWVFYTNFRSISTRAD